MRVSFSKEVKRSANHLNEEKWALDFHFACLDINQIMNLEDFNLTHGSLFWKESCFKLLIVICSIVEKSCWGVEEMMLINHVHNFMKQLILFFCLDHIVISTPFIECQWIK